MALYSLTVSNGNYTTNSISDNVGYIGACSNLACKFDDNAQTVQITDKAYRLWLPILNVAASDLSVNGSVMTYADLKTYLQSIIVSGGGGGGGSTTWGSITGTLSSQTDLNTALGSKQPTLTAGSGISIVNNVISATGGGGGGVTTPIQQYDVVNLVKKSKTINYTSGYYYSLSKSVGESISINSPASNASGYCCVIPITDDFQKVILHSYNSSASTRPWAITNSSGVILAIYDWGSQSAAAHIEEIKREELPNGSAYIVCDSWDHSGYTGHYAEIYTSVASDALSQVNLINPLAGKKVVVFGDSIVEGVDNKINNVYTSFADYLKNWGCEVTKLGVGGTHLTPSSLTAQSSFNGYSVYHLITAWCTQIYTVMDATTEYIADSTEYGDRWAHVPATIKSTTPNDFDVVIIAGGTNDWNNAGRVIGNWTDQNVVYNYTATLRSVISSLRSVNPNIFIVVMSPIVRWMNYSATPSSIDFSDNSANPNSGLWLPDVAGKMAEVTERSKAMSINAYTELGINESNFSEFFTIGGVHPNNDGQLRMAELVGNSLSTNLFSRSSSTHYHQNLDFLNSLSQSVLDGKADLSNGVFLIHCEYNSGTGAFSLASSTTLASLVTALVARRFLCMDVTINGAYYQLPMMMLYYDSTNEYLIQFRSEASGVDILLLVSATNNTYSFSTEPIIWSGNETAYNNIQTKDPNKLYYITSSNS